MPWRGGLGGSASGSASPSWGSLARFLGMEERTELIRAYGAREILTGVGLLSQDDPVPWLWARVGGDALDLGTLAMGLRHDHRVGAMSAWRSQRWPA
jgi:hypothetical protein